MPYTRKTPRRLHRHIITLADLIKANCQVTAEMEQLGLWADELDDVDVWLVPVSYACYGWFQPEADIYIPAVTGAHLSDFISGHHTRLTDVLRHEWAHALADRCYELVETRRFVRTFGGHYDTHVPLRAYDPSHHLTPYAAASPCEDFAETFHFYLRHKGRLPLRPTCKPAIARKWQFVEWMAGRISGLS